MSASALVQIQRKPNVNGKHLAVAGKSVLVHEYKRKMTGYPFWKQAIFHVFLAFARFCDTVLELPVIIHHSGKKKGRFRIDYCGTFDTRTLADAAIESMKAQRKASGEESTFGWVDLDHNAVAPGDSGRYHDAGFDVKSKQYDRANRVIRCPVNNGLCNPDETVSRRKINEVAASASQVVERARELNSLTT